MLGLQPMASLGSHPHLPTHAVGRLMHTRTKPALGLGLRVRPEAFPAPHTHDLMFFGLPRVTTQCHLSLGPFPCAPLGPTQLGLGGPRLPVAYSPPQGSFWAVSFYLRHPCRALTHDTSPKLFWGSNFDPIILCLYYFASTIDPVWPDLLN